MTDPSMHQPNPGSDTRADSHTDDLATGPIPARTAHQLAMDLEHLGLDSAQVRIATQPARGADEVGRVDRRSVDRPARRAAMGSAAGAAVGIGLGLVATAIWSLEGSAVLIAAGIVGAALGGLWSVYAGLATNVAASDLETGHWAVVHVAVDGLDLGTSRIARRLVREADASARRTPARQTGNPQVEGQGEAR